MIVGIDSRRVLGQIRIKEVSQGEHMAVKHKWILKRVDITKKNSFKNDDLIEIVFMIQPQRFEEE